MNGIDLFEAYIQNFANNKEREVYKTIQVTISVKKVNHTHIMEFCGGLSMVVTAKRCLGASNFFFWGLSVCIQHTCIVHHYW